MQDNALSSLQIHRTKKIHWYFKDETQILTDWKEFSFSLDWTVDIVGKRNTGLLECQGVELFSAMSRLKRNPELLSHCALLLFACLFYFGVCMGTQLVSRATPGLGFGSPWLCLGYFVVQEFKSGQLQYVKLVHLPAKLSLWLSLCSLKFPGHNLGLSGVDFPCRLSTRFRQGPLVLIISSSHI